MLPCPVQFHRVRPLLRVEAFAAPVRTIPSTLSHAPRRRSPLRPVCAIPISVLRKLPIVVAHSVRGHKAASLAVVLWIYASSLSTRSGVPRRTSPPRSGRTPIPGAEAAPDRAVGMGHMAHSHCPDPRPSRRVSEVFGRGAGYSRCPPDRSAFDPSTPAFRRRSPTARLATGGVVSSC